MRRLPIRARLTAAFALAMVVVLAATGVFVHTRLQIDLDENLNAGLQSRAAAVSELVTTSETALSSTDPSVSDEKDEGFVQLLAPSGRVLDSSTRVRRPVLSPSELRRAARRRLLVERRVPGIDGRSRVLARPISGRAGASVLVVGRSLEDRDDELSGLARSFAVGGPLAVLLSSLIGYALATAGLAPVEAIRRRAAEVSLSGDEERLPLPAAHDEIRRLGETLNDMLGRLRRSFERERRFVADASHELRTPVAVIKTELEGALRTGDYGPHVREALVAAVEECDHLAQLAEDLLVIARATDGRLPVRPERLQAGPLLDGVRERFGDRAAQHGRGIRVDAPADLGLWGDPLRLRQALGNLADNALRHGAGDVLLSARRTDGGIELDVADQGSGFPPDLSERAFERFTRADGARTRGGAGLGLAIVRAVAEAHGGSAAIVAGPGATVRVSLPGGAPRPAGDACGGMATGGRRLPQDPLS